MPNTYLQVSNNCMSITPNTVQQVTYTQHPHIREILLQCCYYLPSHSLLHHKLVPFPPIHLRTLALLQTQLRKKSLLQSLLLQDVSATNATHQQETIYTLFSKFLLRTTTCNVTVVMLSDHELWTTHPTVLQLLHNNQI